VDGRVVALHRKPEVAGERGLPKPAASELEVDARGVKGDFNRYRTEKLSGDPDSALLLLPQETIRELNVEGWPVAPGDFGENVTTEGIPYASFRPGSTWQLGSVVATVSRACDPCNFLYLLPYVGEKKGPAFLKTTLGRRGWYARVVTPGRVRVGDPIRPR
jgi:MOSC domain-containing protein YiiM